MAADVAAKFLRRFDQRRASLSAEIEDDTAPTRAALDRTHRSSQIESNRQL
jgi:hypothetical protein